MTGADPPERDPALQAEIDRAVTWWTRHLQGRILPGLDARDIARRGVEAMHAEGWWPHTKPEPLRRHGTGQPANAEFREQLAKLRGEPSE